MSQPPATAARHTVAFASTTSGGHTKAVPLHVSAMSQPPATAGRHVTRFAFGSHALAVPLQSPVWQLVAPVAHSFAGSVPPVIGLQAPLLPVVKLPWHDSQVPLHTTSQHTAPPGSFWHTSLAHSEFAVHGVPSTSFGTHSLLASQ
jgi:hypothetical protein